MTQLSELARPFSGKYVRQKDTGKFTAAYVEHSDITQRLLQVCGPYSFRCVEIVRADGQIQAVVAELEVEVDGRTVTVQEAGDCEQPDNWKTEGARLKDAMSDALKRCAMRLGLGLHLWCGDHYFLDKALSPDGDR